MSPVLSLFLFHNVYLQYYKFGDESCLPPYLSGGPLNLSVREEATDSKIATTSVALHVLVQGLGKPNT
jgi:hypothetical protein